MPRVSCGKCSRELEYTGDRPQFCAYCGQSLATPRPEATTHGSTVTHAPAFPNRRGDETVDFVPTPGSRARAEIPDQVKGYRLLRQLGRGGMGTVFEAEDSRIGRKVALKIIAPGYVESPGAVERFRQEGRLASSLSHPRCVFVLEADEDDDGRPFIAMELMTGDTLQDMVEKGGPLPVGTAVAQILDVVEGLREAHRLGLIHRDVKPSNCFLDGEGRVKVGDFGLSKSQVGSSHLTRTGSFLGTPLYASPEQIKVETLDARTDVYSTSATLFFLLTGRAPFDRGDASATMARIVTDPAPSAREKRPEVPQGLDRVIRKGLERDRDRRYRDLDEFRAALVPFVPGHVASMRLGLRSVAYLIDHAACFLLGALLISFIGSPIASIAVELLLLFVYFTLGDGIWGGSPGKRLLRMHVVDAEGREPAGLGRSAVRSAIFLALAALPLGLASTARGIWGFRPEAWAGFWVSVEALGLVALGWPILAGSGQRGLHDRIAGTRVVGLPRDEKRRSAGARRLIGRDRGSVTRPVGVMKAIGPYKIRGAIRWEPGRRVVAGEDSSLGREAWIAIRPKGTPPPGPNRREVARATRPRWLAGGDQVEGHWDAYVAPNGCPLADLAGPEGLPWRDARPIVEDLADELAAACVDGTLPPGLTVDQVWVQPDGRAILVDALSISGALDGPDPATDDQRALSLLRRVAALALEGGRCRSDAIPGAIRSPVPLHASSLLDRLLGGPDAFADVSAFRAELNATRNLPTEVVWGHRAMHLLYLSAALCFGLAFTFISAEVTRSAQPDPTRRLEWAILLVTVFPITWVAWDFLTRGGFALRLSGLGLILEDGRPAPRWRCAWRTAVTWTPMVVALIATVWIGFHSPKTLWMHKVPINPALAFLPIYAALALAFPSRGPHDRLSGLRVVPR